MHDSDRRMIETQAAIISKHNKTITELGRAIEILECRMRDKDAAADAWRALQEQIATNDTLQSEWDRFLGVLRMAGDEAYIKINYRRKRMENNNV